MAKWAIKGHIFNGYLLMRRHWEVVPVGCVLGSRFKDDCQNGALVVADSPLGGGTSSSI